MEQSEYRSPCKGKILYVLRCDSIVGIDAITK